jgi:DNA (cytosine-5)-methyltransferase 1
MKNDKNENKALSQTSVTSSPFRILNLYAGIGGNRKLWNDENFEITAVEYNEEIAMIYQDQFKNDTVIVGDAHDYLLKNYMNFDFIWSSPPCPTHSRMRYMCTKTNIGNGADRDVKFVDMKLYQEILLLDNYFEGKWVVENVIPYYEPLIPAKELGRHLFWSNFKLGKYDKKGAKVRGGKMKDLQEQNGFDLSEYKIKHRKDTILRNCVDSELGLHILKCALNIPIKQIANQVSIFDNVE